MKQFVHNHVSTAGSLITAAIFDLSGLCNVLLFIYTRRGLLLFPGKEETMTPESTAGVVEGTNDTPMRTLGTDVNSAPGADGQPGPSSQ
jgi:hypothetical protein